MKQVKFLTVALMALMGTMATSCMNGDENTIASGAEVVRMNHAGGFTNRSGLKLVPTKTLMPPSGKMFILHYSYDTALQEITSATTKVNVDVLGTPECIDGPDVYQGTLASAQPNVAIGSMAIFDGYYTIKPYLFDKDMMILPIGFKLKTVTTQDELKKELEKHSLTVLYDPEAIKADDKMLTLYLAHRVQGESEGELASRTMNYATYKAYDISSALYSFEEKTGKKPEFVNIIASENESSDKLETAVPSAEKYKMEYKFKD